MQGVALAGRGTPQPAHRGLGPGPARRGRGPAAAGRQWQALPKRYRCHCWYFTDSRGAYVGILPRWHHRRCPKGSGGTSIVEAINCSLRQRCGVLVRKSCSFSKSLQMHEMRIKIVIDYYNITLN